MLEFSHIDHLNLNVSNLVKSVDFYRQLFGLEPKEEGFSSSGNRYQIIGRSGQLMLCLYENPAAVMNAKGSMNHFGIHVNDFNDAIVKIKSLGLKLLYGGINEYPDSRSLYISDPDGNEIELSERFGGDL